MRALLVIDYTVDFVVGKLPCGEPGIQLEDRIAELTESFAEAGDLVIMSVDVHEENDPYHPETRLFPPHNIRDTEGRELYGKLKDVYEKHHNQIHWMDKTRYSAFCGTNLEILLRSRGVNELHLIGVCTDICILHTAVEAYNKGFSIVIHTDGVASFNPTGHEWALTHFQNTLGATLLKKDKPVQV